MLTQHLTAPCEFPYKQRGIGYCTDIETHRTYFYAFYCGSNNAGNVSKVYRFNINEIPLEWEFIGEVDIKLDYTCISPCSRYLWSMEIHPQYRDVEPQDLYFRQIEIKTLKYVDFATPKLSKRFIQNMISLCFRHTQQGTFVFISAYEVHDDVTSFVDKVFRLQLNENQKRIELEYIDLPKVPTHGPYPMEHIRSNASEKWETGLVENQESIYFYRINYFGDIHLLYWQPRSLMQWVQCNVEGNYRPGPIVKSKDPNFNNHFATSWKDWEDTVNRLMNNKRYLNLPDGVAYESNDPGSVYVFYHLEFSPESCSCRCTELFRTFDQRTRYAYMTIDSTKETRIFSFNNFSEPYKTTSSFWEQMFFGEVPKLKYIAYWAVRQQLRRRKSAQKKGCFTELYRQLIGIFKTNNDTKELLIEPEDWPVKKTTVYGNTTYAVSSESIICLLKMLTTNQFHYLHSS